VLHDRGNDSLALVGDTVTTRNALDDDVGHQSHCVLACPAVAVLLHHIDGGDRVVRLADFPEIPAVTAVGVVGGGQRRRRTCLPPLPCALKNLARLCRRSEQHHGLFCPIALLVAGLANDLVAQRFPVRTVVGVP